MAASLSKPGAELSFDFDRHLSSKASREMRFGRSFFDRISREMELAERFRGNPASDGSEYDKDEQRQAFLRSLSVTSQSRFLNLAADNHVTWPATPTLVKFDGYQFVLMPRTKEHVQSINLDLTANRLDEESAITLARRFLSVLAWCDNNFAALGFGWSGNPVPVPVSKPDLAFRATPDYIFDRRMPATPESKRALALYREALNAEHHSLVSYAVLNYYKIIELTQKHRAPTKKWFQTNFDYVRGLGHLKDKLAEFDRLRGATSPHEYIHSSCRIAVAHAGKDSTSDPDEAIETLRLHVAADIMQSLARFCIETEYKISDCMFDGT